MLGLSEGNLSNRGHDRLNRLWLDFFELRFLILFGDFLTNICEIII